MAEGTGETRGWSQHTRLFELGDLVEPRPVTGRLRPATLDEQDLVASWYDAFMADADEQAGREPGRAPHETPTTRSCGRRIEGGRVFVWVDESGQPGARHRGEPPGVRRLPDRPGLHPQGAPRPRLSPVRPCAEVSGLLRASGERACLFTDQANPTSNKIYEAIGYRRVVDMANLRVE